MALQQCDLINRQFRKDYRPVSVVEKRRPGQKLFAVLLGGEEHERIVEFEDTQAGIQELNKFANEKHAVKVELYRKPSK